MKFGTQVWIKRGSEVRSEGTPGCLRFIKGVLIGARGKEYSVKLEEDDPLCPSIYGYCRKKGEVGWWSKFIVTKRIV